MDTIFAPITGIGGSIITIRISGNQIQNIISILKIPKNKIKPNYIFYSPIYDENEKIDDCMIAYFANNKSFTGQESLEISIHANKIILNKLIQTLSKIPECRYAEPGEFTKIAFLNKKIDLLQAESINQLIKSENQSQLLIANQFLSGKISNKYLQFKESIINIISNIEAIIDFPDDDIPCDLINQIKKLQIDLLDELKKYLENKSYKIFDTPIISICGKPNTGKSSLINFFVNRDLSIVSDLAGTTRDVIEAKININGKTFSLFDTAGIRHTSKNKIEKIGIEKALNLIILSNIRIFIIDLNKFVKKDLNLINEYGKEDDLIIINKIDLDKSDKSKKIIKIINNNLNNKNLKIIQISLKNNINLDLIKSSLSKIVNQFETQSLSNIIFINERHYSLLNKAYNELVNFNLNIDNLEIEIIKLYTAVKFLKEIIGEVYSDDILESIFKNFCIGK